MTARDPNAWFPSNSDHGYAFEAKFCHHCAGYFGGYCRILLRAICDGQHPKWVRADNEVNGECLNFKMKGDRTVLRARVQNKNQGVLL